MTKTEQAIIEAAQQLFARHGWARVSIEEICTHAQTSRVTFYKYFPNKKSLLKHLFILQKEETKAAFIQMLEREEDLPGIIRQIFFWQKKALEGMYSQPMLADLGNQQDEELDAFFRDMEKEKYTFMFDFFSRLQAKKIIRSDFPIVLIDVFIRKIDEMLASPVLIEAYGGNEQKMLQDSLSLLMYGISYQKQ